MVITLIPKNVAVVGYEYLHMGGVDICDECRLKNVCVDSLKENQRYRVISVRNKDHDCLVDNDKMIVCEVEECNSIVTVMNNKIMEGVIITREPSKCTEIFCKNYEKCLPFGFEEESRVKILKIISKVECPLEFDFLEVEVEKMI